MPRGISLSRRVELGTAPMRFSRLRCSVDDLMRKSFVWALLLVALVAAGCRGVADKAGGTASTKATVLTLAIPFGQPTELNGFANEVMRLSDGTMRIDVKPRWRY